MQWMYIIYARTHSFQLYKFVCTICFGLDVNVGTAVFWKASKHCTASYLVIVIIILYKEQYVICWTKK